MARANFKRLDADVRRQSLIDATARCLARHGPRVSVRLICKDAGVSAGLLRHYFSGVDELIAATYADIGAMMSRTMQAAADAERDPRAALHAFVMASFKPPIMDPELLATWLSFWSLVNSDPAIRALHRDMYDGFRRPVETLVARIMAMPPTSDDVRMLAVAITALVDGLWLELCLDAHSFSAAEAESIAAQWLDRMLAAPAGPGIHGA
jgi:AcrR family transcriptional regulator